MQQEVQRITNQYTISLKDGIDNSDDNQETRTSVAYGAYASENAPITVVAESGDVLVKNAEWVRPVKDDPTRFIAGDDNNVVEIIGGEKPVVRRRNKTTRWDDFGEGCENTGIHSPLYFPSEPEYTALKK